ncbi:hypothetical protein PVAG01_09824 [Phlyctema vagabunda]|uniref:Uncharacterized protein n=1 Tax=Phlyctema vagabunda TaxID=108571 RepID=A0ABR4P482_9HELO
MAYGSKKEVHRVSDTKDKKVTSNQNGNVVITNRRQAYYDPKDGQTSRESYYPAGIVSDRRSESRKTQEQKGYYR